MMNHEFDRALIAYAFEFALDNLWDGRGDYYGTESPIGICGALPVGPAGDMARQVVMERLGGYFGVVTWLIKNGHMKEEERYSHAKIQEYRRAWLQSLIEEFTE